MPSGCERASAEARNLAGLRRRSPSPMVGDPALGLKTTPELEPYQIAVEGDDACGRAGPAPPSMHNARSPTAEGQPSQSAAFDLVAALESQKDGCSRTVTRRDCVSLLRPVESSTALMTGQRRRRQASSQVGWFQVKRQLLFRP